MPQHPIPDPTPLLRLRDGAYAADFVIAAVGWIDLLTWLAANPTDRAGVCSGLGLAERPADVLCTLLTALGLVEPADGGVLAPTSLARTYLVAGAPFDLRPYYASLRDRPVCRELAHVLRTGEPAAWSSADEGEDWERMLDDPAGAERLTAAMDARGTYLAESLAQRLDLSFRRRLLDVAGGSGIYACALARRFPQLAATVLERPPVDQAARTLLSQRGWGRRVEVVAGDMFAALPEGSDVHLFSHVLHDWGAAEVRALLERSFEALAPGGLLVDYDAHVNRDKSGPLAVAEYSVLLMHSTRGKCWSVGELEAMLAEAGFGEMAVAETGADRSVVTARKPA